MQGIRKGFTLIELLVYMAIMGFIIVVAGKVFSDATGMRVRSQNMLASSEEIGNLSAIIKEDISQMGAKVLGVSSASNYKFEVREKVYISTTGTGDSSSYMLWHSPRGDVKKDSLDSLIFRKIDYLPLSHSSWCWIVGLIDWADLV